MTVRARPAAGRADVVLRLQILFLLGLSAVVLYAVVNLAGQVGGPTEASHVQPRGLVWGGRTFVDLREFAQWLEARGYSYTVWAQQHRRRAGLPPLPVPAAPKAQDAAPRWVPPAIGAAAVAFAICCIVILGRRRRLWRGKRDAPGHTSWRERVQFEATWWKAALEEARRLARAVSQIRPPRPRPAVPRLDVDWRGLPERIGHALRVARIRAAPRLGDTFWYVAATLLAVAMSLAVTRWG